HGYADVFDGTGDCRRSNGDMLYGIPLCSVQRTQVSPAPRVAKKEMAAGNEKECIGTAIHICTQKKYQLYYDRFKEKNQTRKKEAGRTDPLDHPVRQRRYRVPVWSTAGRSEEHTSELQSRF